MNDDLIGLEKNRVAIRNPFGFDFKYQWNKKWGLMKGDGRVFQVNAPLGRHIAKHLYMAVYYQYHDTKVAEIKARGDYRGARQYRVSDTVRNKIWNMITGDAWPRPDAPKNYSDEEKANLATLNSELVNQLSEIDGVAASGAGVDITTFIDNATAETIEAVGNLDNIESAHTGGTTETGFASDPEPVEEVHAADLEQAADVPSTGESAEFAELETLDNA